MQLTTDVCFACAACRRCPCCRQRRHAPPHVTSRSPGTAIRRHGRWRQLVRRPCRIIASPSACGHGTQPVHGVRAVACTYGWYGRRDGWRRCACDDGYGRRPVGCHGCPATPDGSVWGHEHGHGGCAYHHSSTPSLVRECRPVRGLHVGCGNSTVAPCGHVGGLRSETKNQFNVHLHDHSCSAVQCCDMLCSPSGLHVWVAVRAEIPS